VMFMRANIVGTVIILSLIVWIPASCIVAYIVSISHNFLLLPDLNKKLNLAVDVSESTGLKLSTNDTYKS